MKNKKQFQEKYSISDDQFSGKEKIGGSLDLSGLTSIPQGFNPTVGGSLDLRGLTSIPQGFNPTVGGDLYLRGLTSIPQGFNPTVGGSLDLSGQSKYIGSSVLPISIPEIELSWQNGKYKKIDGIFCELTSPIPHTVSDVEIYRLKKVNKEEFLFLAKQDNFYAHAKTIDKAIEDVRFKIIAEKVKKEPIKRDTIITRQHYRIITGACEFGVNEWMVNNNIKKEEITAEELLPILEKTNAYGLNNFRKLVEF